MSLSSYMVNFTSKCFLNSYVLAFQYNSLKLVKHSIAINRPYLSLVSSHGACMDQDSTMDFFDTIKLGRSSEESCKVQQSPRVW